MKKEEKIYVVKFSKGSYEDFQEFIIFATLKKSVAQKYRAKFNRILKKWKKYYSQFETNEYGFIWIKDEFIKPYFYRWNSIRGISSCYIEEVEIR